MPNELNLLVEITWVKWDRESAVHQAKKHCILAGEGVEKITLYRHSSGCRLPVNFKDEFVLVTREEAKRD